MEQSIGPGIRRSLEISSVTHAAHFFCVVYSSYAIDAVYVSNAGQVANAQNPNVMYGKGKFRLPLWYDEPANLMSDIVECSTC